MITLTQVRAQVQAALAGISPDVAVYLDNVPDAVPLYADRRPKPYLLVWVSAPTGLGYTEALDNLADTSALDLTVQVQCCGPDTGMVWELAADVTATLTNRRIGAGVLKPDVETNRATTVQIDTTETPHLPYLPLLYTLQTH